MLCSGILWLRRKGLLLFGREQFQTACFASLILEKGSWTDVERLFKSLLARNERGRFS
jgi:hypothetical protein